MSKIVCFGESLIDMLAEPPATPDAPRAFLQHAGGAPANVAVAVARLGGEAHFVGMLGRDMFGDFLIESLLSAGVLIDGIARTDVANTALAFVALDAEGERSFSFYRPPAADLLFRDSDFRDDSFVDARCFHVCSNSLTEPTIAAVTCAGMRRARAAGALVSMDLNLRPALWRAEVDPTPWLWQALELADLVKLSREELDFLATGSDADAVHARLFAAHARCVIVTDGAAPLHWRTCTAQGQCPTFAVSTVDSTGAGDAFVGGLLCALAERGVDAAGLDDFCIDSHGLDEALRFAAAVGALAVTRKGAFAAMPSRTEVDALLQTLPEKTA